MRGSANVIRLARGRGIDRHYVDAHTKMAERVGLLHEVDFLDVGSLSTAMGRLLTIARITPFSEAD